MPLILGVGIIAAVILVAFFAVWDREDKPKAVGTPPGPLSNWFTFMGSRDCRQHAELRSCRPSSAASGTSGQW